MKYESRISYEILRDLSKSPATLPEMSSVLDGIEKSAMLKGVEWTRKIKKGLQKEGNLRSIVVGVTMGIRTNNRSCSKPGDSFAFICSLSPYLVSRSSSLCPTILTVDRFVGIWSERNFTSLTAIRADCFMHLSGFSIRHADTTFQFFYRSFR